MLGKIVATLDGYGLSGGKFLLVLGIILILSFVFFTDINLGRGISFLVATMPLWLPTILFFIFYENWMGFIQKQFNLNQGGRVTLEILVPQEIKKSPQAMEMFLSQMYQPSGPDNLVQTYWDGKNPPTYGLEIVSRGGSVHFYINTQKKKFKNLIEAQLYAQYPGIEIRELPVDYTAEVVWDEEEDWKVFSLHFNLKKEDVLPIKTYIDYGLDQNPKEEEKIDPIASMMDMLNAIGPGEQVWIQLLIRPHRKEDFEVGSLHKSEDWKDDIKKKINEIMQRDEKGQAVGLEGEGMPRVTDGERKTVEALERSLSKVAFNTTIRGMYIARSDNFLPGERIGALITSFLPFGDRTRNEIGIKWRTDTDYPWWEDPKGKKVKNWKKEELEFYKKRTHVMRNKGDGAKVFSVEELATIFHLPGEVIFTPGLGRIPSTRAEAPPNLPTGS